MKRSITSISRSGGSAILLALLFLHNLTIATSQQNQISGEQQRKLFKRQQRVTRRQQQRRRQRNVVGIGNGIVDSTVSDNQVEVVEPAEDTKLEQQQEDELQLLVAEGENEEQQRIAYFKEHIQQENELMEMEWDTNYVYDVQVSSL